MSDKQLKEIIIRLTGKGYGWEEISWGDDLYGASEEEKERAYELYEDFMDGGRAALQEE